MHVEYYLYQNEMLYQEGSHYLLQEKGTEKEDTYQSMYFSYSDFYPEKQYPKCSEERLLYVGTYGEERRARLMPLLNSNRLNFENNYEVQKEFFLFEDSDLIVRIKQSNVTDYKFIISKTNGDIVQELALKTSNASKLFVSPRGKCFMYLDTETNNQ